MITSVIGAGAGDEGDRVGDDHAAGDAEGAEVDAEPVERMPRVIGSVMTRTATIACT